MAVQVPSVADDSPTVFPPGSPKSKGHGVLARGRAGLTSTKSTCVPHRIDVIKVLVPTADSPDLTWKMEAYWAVGQPQEVDCVRKQGHVIKPCRPVGNVVPQYWQSPSRSSRHTPSHGRLAVVD